MNGTRRVSMNQISIILTYDVAGKLCEMARNRVQITRISVRFTVIIASKKKGLKKLVVCEIITITRVGRKLSYAGS